MQNHANAVNAVYDAKSDTWSCPTDYDMSVDENVLDGNLNFVTCVAPPKAHIASDSFASNFVAYLLPIIFVVLIGVVAWREYERWMMK
jgi:hypothetical protein